MTIKRQMFSFLFARRLERGVQALFRFYGDIFALHRPLFIIGINRSGTTLLKELLAKSTQIVNWSEANELWDPIGFPWEQDRAQRPYWLLDPQGYADRVISQNGLTDGHYGRAIPGICSMFVSAHRGNAKNARFLNKCPMNILRMHVLRQLFPTACFIGIVRDPRAVIRSMAEKSIAKFAAHPRSAVGHDCNGDRIYIVDGAKFTHMEFLGRLCKTYNYVVNHQLDQFKSLPDVQRFEVRYEDFVHDIHGVLARIDTKFDLNPGCRVLDKIPVSQKDRNVKFHEQFNDSELNLISDLCKDTIRKLGYEF